MRTNAFLLFVAVAFLTTCGDLIVAEKAVNQVQDSQLPLKIPQSDSTARNLKGTHEMAEADVADEEERGPTQVINKLRSILGRNPVKISKKKLEKVRWYAKEKPHTMLLTSHYLGYFYGISLLALMAGGAVWRGMRPAGTGDPKLS